MKKMPLSAIAKKIEHWKSQLIDLSKRNRLLYFRETKTSTVQITQPPAEEIFDWLVRREKSMIFQWREQEAQVLNALETNSKDPKLKPGLLLTPLNNQELAKILRNLRLKSRTALQEQGVNVLFVAFGLLEWAESQGSEPKIRSPLVLVPVSLTRGNITSPYEISLLDEEVVLNPTLIHKMYTDFGITLSPLPEDPDSLDLQTLFNQLKQTVGQQTGWSIVPEVYLGLFSFTKLVMYKDLETYADLAESHPIIAALAGDCSKLPPIPDDLPKADNLDDKISPEETFQVLDADSSQQEAIVAAKRGVSFVLQGPPGTGKSQTIANIIAECLASDKTVLFVSAKMAALEIVKKRLDDNGLGQFCLELHSHKANKRVVIEELGRTLDASMRENVNFSEEKLEQLSDYREKLNNYVRALHTPRGQTGKTAFQIHGELVHHYRAPDLTFHFPEDPLKVSREQLRDINELLQRLAAVPSVFESYHYHPWHGCRISSWSFTVQEEIKQHLEEFIASLDELEHNLSMIVQIFPVEKPSTITATRRIRKVLELALQTPLPVKSWFNPEKLRNLTALAENAQQVYQEYFEQRRQLLSHYRPPILEIDADSLLSRFKTEYRNIFIRFFKLTFWRDLASLRALAISKQSMSYTEAMTTLELIKSVQEKSRWIKDKQREHQESFGKYFSDLETNWGNILHSLRWVQMFVDECKSLGIEESRLREGSALVEFVCERREDILVVRRLFPIFDKALSQLEEELSFLEKVFNINSHLLSNLCIEQATLPILRDWLQHLSNSLDKLREWINLQNTMKECEDNGLSDFISKALDKKIKAEQLVPAFDKHFCKLWLATVYDHDKNLRDFNSSRHHVWIDEFRKLDGKQLQIAQARIQKKLAARRPQDYWVTAPSAEQTVLRREMAKKLRHKPTRKLFSEIPNLLGALKPCLLMSPLSVSKFLDPNRFEFDVVVFDEASQICTEDAVGAIMRGKQLIVVGDRKQLPPTRFFAAMGVEDFEDEEAAEMDVFESILDECTTIGLLQKMLLWHYRSRHESLIAFSNYHFYENRLNTFPSAELNDSALGIEFVYVSDGIYDRGKSRKNIMEARTVAKLVFRHFKDFPERSLGVVAFSEAQQMAILDELEKLRLEKPEHETFFDERRHEPFFVKNLENVQGDERDVMLFSIGYGKDALGRMSMSFGPLNGEGGQRRLNVAITRARYHVKLIASIQPTDIDISRTESRGVKLLRNYMEFAQRKCDIRVLLSQTDANAEAEFGSPFEEEVYKALIDQGLTVHKQIGCADYKIDLAIVDSKNPGWYLLGIECDGATYHSAKTARDRDRLRQQVLEGLGWRIHRIWSRDWVENTKREVQKILDTVQLVSQSTPGNRLSNEEVEYHEQADEGTSETWGLVPTQRAEEEMHQQQCSLPAGVILYQTTQIEKLGLPEDFYIASAASIIDILVRVVECEGPVHFMAAARRVANFWGMGKAGAEIRKIVARAEKRAIDQGKIKKKDDFLWPANMEKPPIRRVPPGEPLRDIEEVPLEEIAEAAYLCLQNGFSMSRDDLIVQTARLLGYERTGQKLRDRINLAIQQLLSEGRLEADSVVVKVPKSLNAR